MLIAALQAMRPHQWVKNLLVLAPLLFAHRLTDPEAVREALIAFAVFCLSASTIYLHNDVLDRHADAAHPTKRHRPIASGRLPARAALVMTLMFGGLIVAASLWIDWRSGRALADWWRQPSVYFATWPIGYLALNLLYSVWLKRIVIVDCLTIALGFQIRVHAGAVAIGADTSPWILLCTFFFALFLAFCKRREEVLNVAETTEDRGSTRSTMRDYDSAFLDQLIAPLAALSILTYALWTVAERTVQMHGRSMQFTVPFVVFGVFRYLFLVHKRGQGSDPAKLLFRDAQLVLSGLLWALVVVVITIGQRVA